MLKASAKCFAILVSNFLFALMPFALRTPPIKYCSITPLATDHLHNEIAPIPLLRFRHDLHTHTPAGPQAKPVTYISVLILTEICGSISLSNSLRRSRNSIYPRSNSAGRNTCERGQSYTSTQAPLQQEACKENTSPVSYIWLSVSQSPASIYTSESSVRDLIKSVMCLSL